MSTASVKNYIVGGELSTNYISDKGNSNPITQDNII